MTNNMLSAQEVKLTELASCAGCAAKLGPGALAQVLQPLSNTFKQQNYPALLVGLEAPDDAAVYRINDQQAIISTVDFFPPVVDDPFAYGAIAAANAMSDVYAMGGEVLFVINLTAFPDDLDLGILTDILRGGADRVKAAGAVVAGGHTITDKEPKFGLAVTGMIDPAKVITKGGALPGDALILTKPLGVGLVTTALKRSVADPKDVEVAVNSMMTLNRAASKAAQAVGVHAMTDITGYSLLGHGHEMAHLSNADLTFNYNALAWLPGAQRYAYENGAFPGGATRNKDYYGQWVTFDPSFDEVTRTVMFTPETSGGLLMAVAPKKRNDLISELAVQGVTAQHIGTVQAGTGRINVVP
jgi:selenide, water dikinase